MAELDDAPPLDVVIIGAGPAGLTAATYLRRFLRSCLVIDAGASRASYIPESHNCPGFPQGVSGEVLLQRMRTQAESFGARFMQARVERVARDGEGFQAVAGARCWRARKLILATGLADRLPDVDWAEAAIACGALRLCAVCDAYEARDQRLGLLGPADSLGGHARFLRGYTAQLTLLPSDRDLTAAERAEMEALGVAVRGSGGRLDFDGRRCVHRGAGDEAWFDSVYPYLGYTDRHALLAGLGVEASEDGEVAVDRHQQTEVAGVYAIGDVVSGLNQISVAVGQAAIAATHAHNQLPYVARTG